ncbi:TadG family pilus assembly protein [Novipirellula sp. SH528]|uniref:TadG family pilus assembly protein n=1 Tax=Novipirellula sp. SH528 TaxID=3454466 RepID=UPI003F9F8D3B
MKLLYVKQMSLLSSDGNHSSNRRRMPARKRRGAAAVFGLILTVSLVALMAVTIDMGHIRVAEAELQRSADASAMAACWELFDQQVSGSSESTVQASARQAANSIASLNFVGQHAPEFSSDDVELGTYSPDQSWSTSDPSTYNATRVTLRLQSGGNGELPLFFGDVTGRQSQSLRTTATAAMFSTISGFNEPETHDETLDILPFALDLPSWVAMCAGLTDDDFEFDNGSVHSGSDGLCETNLYPQGTGSPGNRGTVDIGGSNNSTKDLSRQILHGISKQDFIDLGKPLKFDSNGELKLNGDTGISAGVKDELASIIGKVRIIPIYTTVTGNGNNAMYTIVKFEGVRILEVKLTGKMSEKRVIVQPAKAVARYAIVDSTPVNQSSYLFTPVMLVQ